MKSYVGFALDELARRRLLRARQAAAENALAEAALSAGPVISIGSTVIELPYPQGPLASRAVERDEKP